MRDLINTILTLEEDVKKTIIQLVHDTDEEVVLHKVLKTLQAGNLDQRIHDALITDADAKGFIKQITDAIVHAHAPIEEKDEFLDKYSKGIIDISMLLDGNAHSFSELVGAGFPTELFVHLSTSLVSQGVGPGEVALAVMSPDIKWSGRTAGGGDIVVGDQYVEVKTSVKSGGRWINTRKANMNLSGIKEAIETATGMTSPARLGIPAWVNTFRPAIPAKVLTKVCTIIAKGIFSAVDVSDFQSALETGDVAEIQDEMLRTGYENYKKLSGFDGMLMMDVRSQMSQYFKTYDDMAGSIKVDTPYLYGPENEVMPKVSLRAVAPKDEEGSDEEQGTKGVGRSKRVPSKQEFNKAAGDIALGRTRADLAKPVSGSVGREKR